MSHRIDRVNELLKREIGTVVQKDYEWNGLLVTVNAVETTQDIKEAKVWIGVLGGKSPQPVLDKLHAALADVALDKEVIGRFDKLGAEVRTMTPKAFAGYLRTQYDTWAPVIRKINIQAN